MVKYFRDFHELHRNHENFCHKNVLTAPLSTGRAGLKDRQTRQLPRAPKPEGPQSFDSKTKFFWY